MALFGTAHRWSGGVKRLPLPKISHTYEETWHSYALPKEDTKDILIT